MSQLRAPPSARTRAPCTSDFAHGRKQTASELAHARSDCISHKGTVTQGAYSCTIVAGGEYCVKPKVLEDIAHTQLEMKIETAPRSSNLVLNGSALPQYTVQKIAHNMPLKVVCSPVNPFPARHVGPAESFLDACYFCKRPLGHGRDIFMYRGDAAFCTEECRLRQMLSDERRQKCSALASQSPPINNKNHNPKSAH